MKKFLILMFAFGFFTMASAVSEPESFANYTNVFFEILKGTGGNLAMALIIVFAGVKAATSHNWAPLIWGALAVVLIAAAPTMSGSLTSTVSTFMG
jgi:hypothetical protein